jgi:hypothetical protein
VSGRRRRPERVHITCTDSFHRDTAEFARRGFHFVCALDCLPVADGGFTLSLADYGCAAVGPAKDAARVDGGFTYKLLCSCGRDLQLRDTRLIAGAAALFAAARAADPRARRIAVDIAIL